ncbi:MAG: hypothetical protein OEY87_05235 [Gammaproteobacteria bacterium]|nr:hypothetical protein [Gammaproteobacteria bacterium]
MELSIYLNLLWLIPILTWLTTREKSQIMKSTIRGISFGLIVSPASMGLYALYFIGPISAIFGMPGLVLTLLHQPPGYNLAIMFNLIPSHTVVTGSEYIPIALINAFFWGAAYGALGLTWGYFKSKRTKALTSGSSCPQTTRAEDKRG